MREITFSLPKDADKEKAKQQKALSFITYKMVQLHLEPGDSVTIPIRDTPQGLYADWSNEQIIAYYDERYKEYGLVTKVSGTA